MLAKALTVAAGIVCLAVGSVGIFLPVIPTVPLYLLAGVCFARSSRRLTAWLEGTAAYRRHVVPLREGRGMTMRAKLTSFASICLFLGVGFYLMCAVPARWILVAVIVFHGWLFFVRLPTLRES